MLYKYICAFLYLYKLICADIMKMEVNTMSDTRGKASTKAKNKYNAANYDSLRIVIPKGRKELVEEYAATCPEKSINGLVNALLRNALGLTEDEWKQTRDDGEEGHKKPRSPDVLTV